MTLADETLACGQELLRMAGGIIGRDIAFRKAVHCAYYAAFTALCRGNEQPRSERWVRIGSRTDMAPDTSAFTTSPRSKRRR